MSDKPRSHWVKNLLFYSPIILIGAWLISWHSGPQYEYYNKDNERAHYDLVTSVFVRLVDYFDLHAGAITAFSTIMLAIFTWRLWVSTDSLWLAGERQRKVSEDAVGAAQNSLAHAKEISILELRPWIEMNMTPSWGLSYADHFIISCNVEMKNIGRTPAKNVKIESKVIPMPPINTGDLTEFYEHPFSSQTANNPTAILPGGQTSDQQLVFVYWGENTDVDKIKGTIPLVGINILYELPNGEIGQTSASYYVGIEGGPMNGLAAIRNTGQTDIRNLSAKHYGYFEIK